MLSVASLHDLKVRLKPLPTQGELDHVGRLLALKDICALFVRGPDLELVDRESAVAVLVLSSQGVTEFPVFVLPAHRVTFSPMRPTPAGTWDRRTSTRFPWTSLKGPWQ